MSDEMKLKPCPLCGTVPTVEGDLNSEDYVKGHNLGFVECKNNDCPLAGTYIVASTQKEATAIWNHRPGEEALLARAEQQERDAHIWRHNAENWCARAEKAELMIDRLFECWEQLFDGHIKTERAAQYAKWRALADEWESQRDEAMG